jgi:hypothetical protein
MLTEHYLAVLYPPTDGLIPTVLFKQIATANSSLSTAFFGLSIGMWHRLDGSIRHTERPLRYGVIAKPEILRALARREFCTGRPRCNPAELNFSEGHRTHCEL